MFRFYAAETSQTEFFRVTPKSVFLYLGGCLLGIYIYARLAFTPTVDFLLSKKKFLFFL